MSNELNEYLNDNKITFIVNYKEYTIDLSKSDALNMKQMLKKYMQTNTNVDVNDLLLAYINQSKDLLELEAKLENLYLKIQSN